MICLTDYVKKCYDLSTIYLRLTEKGDLFCLIIILRRLLLLPQRIRFAFQKRSRNFITYKRPSLSLWDR